MRVQADLEAPCSPEALLALVDDLSRYPAWLDIVARAVPAPPADDDAGPAWTVDLRGRLGPFARTKRLRMVRTARLLEAEGACVTFERRQHDGRSHAPWVLSARIEPAPAGSRLAMELSYGGTLFGPVLERLLGDEIERAGPRLVALCR